MTPKELSLRPIPHRVAREVLVKEHYLHSYPGATTLAIGVFDGIRLVGVVTLGNGPRNLHRMVEGATLRDYLTLTRLWLHEDCPRNSETHVLSLIVRYLRQRTGLKFLVSYADPSVPGPGGVPHVGYVYQAASWIYVGLSHAMPFADLGDGKPRHLRSLNSVYGTHSLKYFQRLGIQVRIIEQSAKHTYLFFLDKRWRKRLKVTPLPYPKPSVEVMPHGDRGTAPEATA